jgi:hypothetical protein
LRFDSGKYPDGGRGKEKEKLPGRHIGGIGRIAFLFPTKEFDCQCKINEKKGVVKGFQKIQIFGTACFYCHLIFC